MPSKLQELRERLAEISDVGGAIALLAWDERTMMPPGGATARAEQLATLVRIGHESFVSDEVGRLLDGAAAEADGFPYDSDDASLVRMTRRGWEKARRVSPGLAAELTRAASLGETAWVDARRRSDFSAFLPHLERNMELKHRYAECFDGFEDFEHPYDPFLDDFEPGMRTPDVIAILRELRDGIRPLIERVAGRPDAVDASCLHGDFPLDLQTQLAQEVAAGLPLDEGAWRLDPSVHPFATSISPSDVRITTRFDETYIGTALWSVLHEAGHGMYENGVAPELARSPIASLNSLALHESQSRLWENWVGRGRPYLAWILPRLREVFPGPLGDVDAEGLYRAANVIEPSLIRVEADQLTYNMHIILRFELELELVEGKLDLADLPEAWNARMAEYLGVEVPDDANGVLQDVHWAAGLFGYFATYSLGNVIAAQIWDSAEAALPDLEGRIAAGDFLPLREWLRERLHRHGGKFMPKEMLDRVVGGPLSVEPYVRQLGERVAELYGDPSSTNVPE